MAVPRCPMRPNMKEVVVKMLGSRDDVKVNTKDEAGRSPLSCAAEEGHEPVVKLLVTRRCRGGLQGQPGPFAAN